MILKILFILVWLVGFWSIWYFMRRLQWRNFPAEYKELQKIYGKPLAEYGGLSGQMVRHGRTVMQYKSILKLSVYPEMVWITSFGRTLVVPYEKYPISKQKWLFITVLEIKNLPTLDEAGAEIPLDKNGLPNAYTFCIQLSEKKVDFILKQVGAFQALFPDENKA